MLQTDKMVKTKTDWHRSVLNSVVLKMAPRFQFTVIIYYYYYYLNGLRTSPFTISNAFLLWALKALFNITCFFSLRPHSYRYFYVFLCKCFSSNIQTLMGVHEAGVSILPKDILAHRLEQPSIKPPNLTCCVSWATATNTVLFCPLNYEEWVILWSATCLYYLFLASRKNNCIPARSSSHTCISVSSSTL